MSLKPIYAALGLALLAPVAVFAATTDSAPASAGPSHGSYASHRGSGDSVMMFLRSAHLTADQQAQVKSILHESRVAMKPVSDQRRAIHEQIADLLLKPGAVDSAQLAALVQKDEALGKQISEQRLQTSVTVRNLLTPDQLTKVAQTRAQMQTLHHQMQSLVQEQ